MDKETKELPDDDKEPVTVPDVIEPDAAAEAAARARELELENARLKGRLEASPAAPAVDPNAWKAAVWADMNGLDEDSFKAKYNGVSKTQASTKMLEDDFQKSTAQTQQQIAELRAENQLASKYPEFFSHKEAVSEAIADASPEVRRDPAKLAKFMERAFLAAKAANPAPAAKPRKPGEPTRRVVDPAFVAPTNKGDEPTPKAKDDIAPEYKSIARAFGIADEAERKKLSESEFCRMDLGGGVFFESPDRGFEKTA